MCSNVCVSILLVSQVQILIEQEVRSVLKKSETKLQGLLETIQQLDRQIDYESSIQKLEVGEPGCAMKQKVDLLSIPFCNLTYVFPLTASVASLYYH